MLKSIKLINFKAAENLGIRFGALTVLAGLNSSGKSSVLQGLAVLKQTVAAGDIDALLLRGPLVQLGTYSDVYTEGAESEGISIEIEDDLRSYLWRCSGASSDSYLTFSAKPAEIPNFLVGFNFQMLPADRIVPRNMYAKSAGADYNYGVLGPHGEFAVEYLLSSEASAVQVSERRVCPSTGFHVTKELLSKAAPTRLLNDQVSGWMQQLSPGVRVGVSELPGTDEVNLNFGYVGRSGIKESSKRIRPGNVGFGLTYSLPIVVACLAVPSGSLLLLENPEAHLHPQGQAALGQLLARAASDGVQIVVETHSDHVLNGIRLAVKRGLISHSGIAIHYLVRDLETGFVSSVSPAVLADGHLSDWPEGFFDQWDFAIDELVGD